MKRLSFQVSRRWRRWDLLERRSYTRVKIWSYINWKGDNILWTRPGGGAEQGALHLEHHWRKWRLETEDRGLADGQVAAHCWGWPVWGAHQSGGHSSNSDSFLFFTFSSTVESSGVSVRVMCEGPPVSGEHWTHSLLPLGWRYMPFGFLYMANVQVVRECCITLAFMSQQLHHKVNICFKNIDADKIPMCSRV